MADEAAEEHSSFTDKPNVKGLREKLKGKHNLPDFSTAMTNWMQSDS